MPRVAPEPLISLRLCMLYSVNNIYMHFTSMYTVCQGLTVDIHFFTNGDSER